MSDESPGIHELVDATSLLSISFLEISAKRADENASTAPVPDDDGFLVEPEFTLQIGRAGNENKFRVRVSTEIASEPGLVTVDAAAEYALDGLTLSEISEELMLEFVNRVATFALIPYIRQALADITLRVFESPLTMPLYRQGHLEFSKQEPTVEPD